MKTCDGCIHYMLKKFCMHDGSVFEDDTGLYFRTVDAMRENDEKCGKEARYYKPEPKAGLVFSQTQKR